jgi:signal transduction histidine kinase
MADLAPLIDEAVMDRRGLDQANQISVVIGPGAGTALADPGKIKQLLDILLDNAIKFAEPGSPVDIEVAKDGSVTTVRVLDRGIGIPEEAREQVFDRFFQVEELQHHSSVGLGLGLYLAREITAAHGGSIHCEPRPGGGTIFSFEIVDP